MKFKKGDRVIVTYGHGWEGPGAVEQDQSFSNIVIVRMDNGEVGGFVDEHVHRDDTYHTPLAEALR